MHVLSQYQISEKVMNGFWEKVLEMDERKDGWTNEGYIQGSFEFFDEPKSTKPKNP